MVQECVSSQISVLEEESMLFPGVIRDRRPMGPVLRRMKEAGTETEYLQFPAVSETGLTEHLFSTRLGGVSQGVCSGMNLGFLRGDSEENVRENYRRIAQILHCSEEDFVCAKQTHTTNIRRVTQEDRGKGVTRERDYDDVDGLVTDIPGIVLVTYYADCVPLYFVDTVHKAIGLAHSGWKGTAAGMGACMCRRMKEEFGTRPEDLVVSIGPAICRECYEVSEDVASVFSEKFADDRAVLEEIADSGMFMSEVRDVVVPGKTAGKYQLDLWLANAAILRKEGIMPEQISVADICTCHNPSYLFSHRASRGMRGSLAAFLKLR